MRLPLSLAWPLLLAACADPSDDAGPTPEDTGSVRRDSGSSGGCAPPDPDPPATAQGHPTDGWRWQRQGPLFPDEVLFEDPDAVGYNEGALSPTLVDTGDGLHLLFMVKRGASTTLWASQSADGQAWQEPEPVTGLGEGAGSYPSLIHDGGSFTLWYGSGSIQRAESADGVAFAPGETVLRPSADGFDGLSLLYAHAVRTGAGDVALWYTGFDGARFAVGEAACDAEASACDPAAAPSLERDPAGWDNAAVAMPEVVDHAGQEHLWYGGYDTVIADPGPWRIGRRDGTSRRISLPLTDAGVEAYSTRDPAVVPWGDGWLMVYVGMGDDGRYRLVSATSDVCNR